ncbi:hypothetical protein Plhal710r2_c006g0028881 [Plasmopara halstedii]
MPQMLSQKKTSASTRELLDSYEISLLYVCMAGSTPYCVLAEFSFYMALAARNLYFVYNATPTAFAKL